MRFDLAIEQPPGTSISNVEGVRVLKAWGLQASKGKRPIAYQNFEVQGEKVKGRLSIWGDGANFPSEGDIIEIETGSGKMFVNEFPADSGKISLKAENCLISRIEGPESSQNAPEGDPLPWDSEEPAASQEANTGAERGNLSEDRPHMEQSGQDSAKSGQSSAQSVPGPESVLSSPRQWVEVKGGNNGQSVGMAINNALIDARECGRQYDMKWVAARATQHLELSTMLNDHLLKVVK